MRLWHYKLIPHLPDKQLLSQHRECCALRGKGWGKKHSVVDYVFNQNYLKLVNYHKKVMNEMIKRKFKVNNLDWYYDTFRGEKLGFVFFSELPNIGYAIDNYDYFEHNYNYLKENLKNLASKGIIINIERV